MEFWNYKLSLCYFLLAKVDTTLFGFPVEENENYPNVRQSTKDAAYYTKNMADCHPYGRDYDTEIGAKEACGNDPKCWGFTNFFGMRTGSNVPNRFKLCSEDDTEVFRSSFSILHYSKYVIGITFSKPSYIYDIIQKISKPKT